MVLQVVDPMVHFVLCFNVRLHSQRLLADSPNIGARMSLLAFPNELLLSVAR